MLNQNNMRFTTTNDFEENLEFNLTKEKLLLLNELRFSRKIRGGKSCGKNAFH